MKHEIELYKGQSIQYDEERDKFICDIELNGNVKSAKRQSLKEIKGEIDMFIKLNLNFKPFKIFLEEYSSTEEALVSAIRTDGSFVVTTLNSTYKSYKGPKEFHKFKKFDQKLADEIDLINLKLSEAREQHKQDLNIVLGKLEICDLSDYIKFLNQD